MKLLHLRLSWSCLALGLMCAGGDLPASPPANYSRQNLQGKSFKDGNLNKAQFDEADLKGANFSNATLKGANFQKAHLQNVSFQKAVLDDADLSGADLRGVDWADAKAWHTKLMDTEIDLLGAPVHDLSKLNLDPRVEALIHRSDNGALSFHYADMRRCKILGNAAGVDFRGADLRGADFSKTQQLEAANLAGAKFDVSTKWNIDGAKMRAEFVSGSEAPIPGTTAEASVTLSHHPLIGNWLIPEGEKGAKTSGSLMIQADRTFDWDVSAEKKVRGKWSEAGDNILIKDGENGETWTVKRTGPKEVLMQGNRGTERVGILAR
ncbi:MAG TPA: pentapeptide repeat-containing protein [Chthoniobacter sp.]|nr:pentapeptide repeat-containing protein [Chthoniobacter sp.]